MTQPTSVDIVKLFNSVRTLQNQVTQIDGDVTGLIGTKIVQNTETRELTERIDYLTTSVDTLTLKIKKMSIKMKK